MKKLAPMFILILFSLLLIAGVFILATRFSDVEKLLLGGDEKITNVISEPELKSNKVTVKSGDSIVAEFKVKIAADSLTKETGFMFVDHLDEDKGMFFVYKSDVTYGFWMKNCLIALDMIFIDENLNVVSVVNNAPPCTTNGCPIYHASQPYRYVLEVNGGIAEKLGIANGQKVIVEGLEGYL